MVDKYGVKFMINYKEDYLKYSMELFYVNLGEITRQLPSSMSLPYLCHFVTFLIFVLLYWTFFSCSKKAGQGYMCLIGTKLIIIKAEQF
jgi:hypothetical protein